MFKNWAAVFLDPINHVLQDFWTAVKNIPQQACVLGVRTKVQIQWGEDISIQEKQAMPYQYSLYKEY